MYSNTMRPALTLIEVTLVTVILGIVSSIGAEIIAHSYESYIMQRAQYRATMKTELALTQIANRLRYAIPGTVVYRENLTAAISNITEASDGTDNVLQWVSYDGDSFEAISSAADRKPGWSGFCDLDDSTATTIDTPGSNLDLASEIIGNLGGRLSDAFIYLPDGSSYGVNGGAGETITLDGAGIPAGSTLYERYKLAWTSYALEVNGDGDLILHYNFAPVYGTPIEDDQSSILLKNVTNFRFKGSEGSLRIKICKEEKISSDATISACKEKVVF
jgi:Tfp pilus assembly protein PilE